MLIVRFLGLVLLLNILRYAGGFLFEPWVIFPGLFGAMEESASFFRTEFRTIDWVTSYLYNFMMWLPYGILLPLAIRHVNQRQVEIKKAEAESADLQT